MGIVHGQASRRECRAIKQGEWDNGCSDKWQRLILHQTSKTKAYFVRQVEYLGLMNATIHGLCADQNGVDKRLREQKKNYLVLFGYWYPNAVRAQLFFILLCFKDLNKTVQAYPVAGFMAASQVVAVAGKYPFLKTPQVFVALSDPAINPGVSEGKNRKVAHDFCQRRWAT
ncbi:hypothetical protein WH47_04894 [Habropoda laboriosa]|uniref:Uncharacterized protein n=1 Tax=Habropoda laboriosa TaxID=597456 RepID=A0A0L7QVM5_9HYME|nr:hypothetical protein WH47_04894 [Habropoda laboriosa]